MSAFFVQVLSIALVVHSLRAVNHVHQVCLYNQHKGYLPQAIDSYPFTFVAGTGEGPVSFLEAISSASGVTRVLETIDDSKPQSLKLLETKTSLSYYKRFVSLDYKDDTGSSSLWKLEFAWDTNELVISNPNECARVSLESSEAPTWVTDVDVSTENVIFSMSFRVNSITVTYKKTDSADETFESTLTVAEACLTWDNTAFATIGHLVTITRSPSNDADAMIFTDNTEFYQVLKDDTKYYPYGYPFNIYETADNGRKEYVYYRTEAERCFDTSKSVWKEHILAAGKSTCPTGGEREVDCKYPRAQTTEECAGNDFCCNTGIADKCLASTDQMCSLASIATALLDGKSTVGSVDGVLFNDGNYRSYQELHLGEVLTLTCASGLLFKANKDVAVDSPTKTTIPCVIYQENDGKVLLTDFTAIYNPISCTEKCGSITTHDSVLVDIDPSADDVKFNTEITLTCKDAGSAFVSGELSEIRNCISGVNDFSDAICYKCLKPEPATELDEYLVGGTLSAETLYPTQTATYTCKSGYSLANFAASGERDNLEIGCTVTDGVAGVLKPSVKCQRCIVPVPGDHAIHDASGKIGASQVLHVTCEDGYSFANGRITEEVTCSSSVFMTNLPLDLSSVGSCIADCVITAAVDAGHKYTWSQGEVVTEKKSIPTGTSYTIGCVDPEMNLPWDQPAEVSCSASEAITIQSCMSNCVLASLVKADDDAGNRVLTIKEYISDDWENSPTSLLRVPYNTPIKFTCKNTDANDLKWVEKDNAELKCDSDHYDFEADTWTPATPICERKCSISISTYYEVNPSEVEFEDQALLLTNLQLPSVMIRFGAKLKLMCIDPTAIAPDTTDNFAVAVCSGSQIYAMACDPTCSLADLPRVNTNTVMIAALKTTGVENADLDRLTSGLSGENEVVLRCSSDSYKTIGTPPAPLDDYLFCGVDGAWDYKDTSGGFVALEEIQNTDQCFAVPVIPIKSSAIGDMEMEVKIDLPTDRDISASSSRTLEKLEVFDEFDVSVCLVSGESNTVHSYVCTATTTDKEKVINGVSLYAQATFSGVKVDGLPTTGKLYYGPPSLDTSGSKVSVHGTKTVSWTWSTSAKSGAQEYADNSDLGMKYKVVLTRTSETNPVLKSEEISSEQMIGSIPHTFDWGGLLVPIEDYTVTIESISNFGFGGKATTTFKTGYSSPALKDTGTSATTSDITIDIGVSNFGGDLQVQMNLDGTASEETLTFAAGIATKSLSGLTASGTHTLKVTVVSADDVPSDEGTLTFSQGAEPPTIDTNTWELTNEQVIIKWTAKVDYKYRIKLELEQGETDTTVSDTTTDQYTVAGEATKTLDGLTAGSTYKVSLQSVTTVGGVVLTGDAVSEVISLYACAVATKSDVFTIKTATGEVVTATYLAVDAATLFKLSCQEGDQFEADSDGNSNDETACTGAKQWAPHAVCEPIPAAVGSGNDAGKIAGGIIGGMLLLILLIILIYCCCFKRKSDSGNGGSSKAKKYSPRDEEKHQPVNDGGESWKNPYYIDNEAAEKFDEEIPGDDDNLEMAGIITDDGHLRNGTPVIPANKNANGDNISLEQKVVFNEDDDANVVISNDHVYDTSENNV